MSLLLAVLMAVADEPTYPVVVELDNVCGRDCVAILEKALAKIDGVKSAEMYGDKFHFKLEVLDNKVVLPSAILKVTEKITDEGAAVLAGGQLIKPQDAQAVVRFAQFDFIQCGGFALAATVSHIVSIGSKALRTEYRN